MVDTSGTETTLNDLEPFTPSENQVLLGNANVLVDDLVVTFGSVVISELRKGTRHLDLEIMETGDWMAATYYLHRADELNSGSVARDDDDRLLIVFASRSITTHDRAKARVSESMEKKLRTECETYDFPRTR